MVQKTSAAKAPTRGRPRSFNTDEVLERVRDTFWRYGFAGTSMDQLATATGLHKPSLYGAFGDKRRLYLEALNNYLIDVRAQFAEAFARPRLIEALEAVAERAIDKFLRGDDAGTGCFMMNTAMPVAAEDPEISQVVRAAMEALDDAFVWRFRRAIEDGELPPEADARALAIIMVANHYELSGRARIGYSREELRHLAARTIDLVKKLGGLRD